MSELLDKISVFEEREEYIVPDRMIYLVVGDAKTQLERLRRLGLGEPIRLDRQGNPVSSM